MNKHILFVHIPKTAGTSFRKAAAEYFRNKNTFYDYSPNAIETSKIILDTIYEDKDYYKFYSKLSKLEYSFLSGHFPTVKYAALYDTLNVVSFVRDPVEQVLSHYNHYKNHHGYEKSLIDFIKDPRFKNIQSKALRHKNLLYYGFIGVTEQYNTSIDLFNMTYGTELEHLYINKKNKGSLVSEELDQKTLKLIQDSNVMDLALYETVCQQFEVRKKLYVNNHPFTYGFIQKITEKTIAGLAFQRECSVAVEIDIYKGSNYLETVQAKNPRPGQIQNSVPRKGFIGFEYEYEGSEDLEGQLNAVVKATGQEIV